MSPGAAPSLRSVGSYNPALASRNSGPMTGVDLRFCPDGSLSGRRRLGRGRRSWFRSWRRRRRRCRRGGRFGRWRRWWGGGRRGGGGGGCGGGGGGRAGGGGGGWGREGGGGGGPGGGAGGPEAAGEAPRWAAMLDLELAWASALRLVELAADLEPVLTSECPQE